jgi:hypothetical protein
MWDLIEMSWTCDTHWREKNYTELNEKHEGNRLLDRPGLNW